MSPPKSHVPKPQIKIEEANQLGQNSSRQDKKTEKQTSLRINVSNLSEGKHSYKFVAESSEIEINEHFIQPLNVKVELDKTTNQLYLKVDADTNGNFQCDRCLSQFQSQVVNSFELIYMYEGRGLDEWNYQEVKILSSDTNYIDISDDVREYLLLAIPIKLICKEDCKGLCPVCGKNFNEMTCNCINEISDPRWEPLSKLFKK